MTNNPDRDRDTETIRALHKPGRAPQYQAFFEREVEGPTEPAVAEEPTGDTHEPSE